MVCSIWQSQSQYLRYLKIKNIFLNYQMHNEISSWLKVNNEVSHCFQLISLKTWIQEDKLQHLFNAYTSSCSPCFDASTSATQLILSLDMHVCIKYIKNIHKLSIGSDERHHYVFMYRDIETIERQGWNIQPPKKPKLYSCHSDFL